MIDPRKIEISALKAELDKAGIPYTEWANPMLISVRASPDDPRWLSVHDPWRPPLGALKVEWEFDESGILAAINVVTRESSASPAGDTIRIASGPPPADAIPASKPLSGFTDKPN